MSYKVESYPPTLSSFGGQVKFIKFIKCGLPLWGALGSDNTDYEF